MLPFMLAAGFTALSTLTSMAGAKQQALAEAEANQFNAAEQARQAVINRALAGRALEQGAFERDRHLRGFGQEQGERVANMGASGIDVNSGTSLAVLADNAAMAQLDADMIDYNAGMEAWQLGQAARNNEVQAAQSRRAAGYAMQAGRLNMATSLLGGMGSMATAYMGRK